MNLGQAKTDSRQEQFIAEHEAAPPSDEALFNATLAAMVGTSKAVPATSDEAQSDG